MDSTGRKRNAPLSRATRRYPRRKRTQSAYWIVARLIKLAAVDLHLDGKITELQVHLFFLLVLSRFATISTGYMYIIFIIWTLHWERDALKLPAWHWQ